MSEPTKPGPVAQVAKEADTAPYHPPRYPEVEARNEALLSAVRDLSGDTLPEGQVGYWCSLPSEMCGPDLQREIKMSAQGVELRLYAIVQLGGITRFYFVKP